MNVHKLSHDYELLTCTNMPLLSVNLMDRWAKSQIRAQTCSILIERKSEVVFFQAARQ